MSSGLTQIMDALSTFIASLTPLDRPEVTFHEAPWREELRDQARTLAKHESTRAFHAVALPSLQLGHFLGGGSDDISQTVEVRIRYALEKKDEPVKRLYTMASSDAALLTSKIYNRVGWTDTRDQNFKPVTQRLEKTGDLTWIMTLQFTLSWALEV